MRQTTVIATLAALMVFVPAPAALAAPPLNDARAAPQTITARADVRGTTVEATREPTDPKACPDRGGATVWYTYVAPRAGVARLLLDTEGGLDAVVAIYEKERTTLTRIACAQTRRGRLYGQFRFDAGEHLIRVAEREGSAPGPFRLRFSGVLEEPKPPGRALPRSGQAGGTLNALTAPFAQWSRVLRAGHDYRIRVSAGNPDDCDVTVRMIDPDGKTRNVMDCRDYTVLTPDPDAAGRWTIALEARGGSADNARYRVAMVGAGSDDLAPGDFLGDFGVARGRVSGRGPDAQDLYRFDVTRRAEITLSLASRGAMNLVLRTERGHRVTSARVDGETGRIRTRLRPGRFYLTVDAAQSAGGRYRLRRLTRVITSTTVTFDGRLESQRPPGGRAMVRVGVSNGAGGPARIVLERFDPQFGWRFWQRRTIR
ncbi:MAG TPA: hypothetical protein VGJ70_14950, partial [Solirubrobacteraceae bacterium]